VDQRVEEEAVGVYEDVALATVGLHLTHAMADIDVPTLVLQGRHDHVAPWEVGRDLFDAVATPDEHKREVILEDSGHAWGGDDFVIAQREALAFIDASVR